MLHIQLQQFIPHQRVPILIKLLLYYVSQVIIIPLSPIIIATLVNLPLWFRHILSKLQGFLPRSLLSDLFLLLLLGWRSLIILQSQVLCILLNSFLLFLSLFPVFPSHIGSQPSQLNVLSSLHRVEVFLSIRFVLLASFTPISLGRCVCCGRDFACIGIIATLPLLVLLISKFKLFVDIIGVLLRRKVLWRLLISIDSNVIHLDESLLLLKERHLVLH